MAPPCNSRSSLLFPIFSLVILVTFFRSPPFAVAVKTLDSGDSPSRNLLSTASQRKLDRPVPNCTELASQQQCLQNSKCRWCRSEVIDDMCFTKREAFRLPSQKRGVIKLGWIYLNERSPLLVAELIVKTKSIEKQMIYMLLRDFRRRDLKFS